MIWYVGCVLAFSEGCLYWAGRGEYWASCCPLVGDASWAAVSADVPADLLAEVSNRGGIAVGEVVNAA